MATTGGMLLLNPFIAFAFDMRPTSLRSGERGQIVVQNQGNTTADFRLSGRDPGEDVAFNLEPARFSVEPGERQLSEVRIQATSRPWLGRRQQLLDEHQERLEQRGATVHTYAVDVSDTDAMESAITDYLSKAGGIDLVVANADKQRLVEIVSREIDPATMPAMAREPDGSHIYQHRGRTRAFVKVQDGCRNRCSFCTC